MDSGNEASGVTLIAVLVVMSVAQSVFLLLLAVALGVNRKQSRQHRLAIQAASSRVSTPLNEWLVLGGPPTALLAALRALAPAHAREVLLKVAGSQVGGEDAASLGRVLRQEPWMANGLRRARSFFWWRRIEAARLLAFVGDHGDQKMLQALLDDPSGAVRVVAGSALGRVGSADAVSTMLDRLPTQSHFVQLQQFAILRLEWRLVTPLLLEKLKSDMDTPRLLVWIALADALGTVDLFESLLALYGRPQAEVRLAIAKALRNYYHASSAVVLVSLLGDGDARVRARAAQSLGALGSVEAVAPLARQMVDPEWNVRFRCAVALAQLGELGRETLRAVRTGEDHFAADMAASVTGLSAGAINEMADE